MTRVLKIGGSILSDKTREATALPGAIQRVAEEIAANASDLVLVHGAGSFGHVPAKRFGLPERFNPQALRETHRSVVQLNDLVVEALSRAGALPMPVHPFSCTILKEGRIESLTVEPIAEMVKRGLLPVLHGDVAMDSVRGAGIVSGDQLVPYLGRALGAEVVAVGTNVDGVLVSGKPLQAITREDLPSIIRDVGGSTGVDVTGGMLGKLQELLNLADEGVSSVIFNASKAGNIARALKGESLGTMVRGSN